MLRCPRAQRRGWCVGVYAVRARFGVDNARRRRSIDSRTNHPLHRREPTAHRVTEGAATLLVSVLRLVVFILLLEGTNVFKLRIASARIQPLRIRVERP